jgi:CrcB protein
MALFGALGSLLRFALVTVVQRALPGDFPGGTLAVNVLGSAAIGFIMMRYELRGELAHPMRVALTSGLVGGFTTYSSFAFETWSLAERRHLGAAAANVTLTLVVCLAACVGGIHAARALR